MKTILSSVQKRLSKETSAASTKEAMDLIKKAFTDNGVDCKISKRGSNADTEVDIYVQLLKPITTPIIFYLTDGELSVDLQKLIVHISDYLSENLLKDAMDARTPTQLRKAISFIAADLAQVSTQQEKRMQMVREFVKDIDGALNEIANAWEKGK